MSVSKSLDVRQLVLGAKGLHPGPKAVLAELCHGYEAGGESERGAAGDSLARRLGITRQMVSRHLRILLERGFLARPAPDSGSRQLVPVTTLQESYRSGNQTKVSKVVTSLNKSGNISAKSGNKKLAKVVTNVTEVVTFTPKSGNIATESGNIGGKSGNISPAQNDAADRLLICEQALLAATTALDLKEQKLAAALARVATLEQRWADDQALIASLKKPAVARPSRRRAVPTQEEDPAYGKGRLIVEAYATWFAERNYGVRPKLDGSDQKAGKEIFAYLLSEANDKTDEGVTAAFGYILRKWDTIEDFLRRQTRLIQINANLNNIISQLRDAKLPTPTRPHPAGLIPSGELGRTIDHLAEIGL